MDETATVTQESGVADTRASEASAPETAAPGAPGAERDGAVDERSVDGEPGAEEPADKSGAEEPATPGSEDPGSDGETKTAHGVGQGAAAVVSAGLGIVSLTGGWIGTVASARESLIGQLHTSQSAQVAKQVQEVYGDSWNATALVGGIFALVALLVGAAVLVRPAFGAPGPPQAAWTKSVAWAGVSLGVIGLLLAAAKYADVLLGLPSTP